MQDYNAHLVRHIIFPLSQRVRGLNYSETLREALINQSLNREQIRILQFQKLSELLQHAFKHVPYYRDLFKRIGISPNDIRTWRDFEALPVLTKEEVRENMQTFISEQPRAPVQKYMTSGSTGQPLKILTSRIAAAGGFACTWRAHINWGVHIGDRAVHVRGDDDYLFKISEGNWFRRRIEIPLKERAFNRRFLPVSNVSEDKLVELWRLLESFKPVYLSGYPSALYLLALKMRDLGVDGSSLGLRLIGSGGEILYDVHRRTLQEVFNCPVENGYGAFEIGIAANTYPCGDLHTNDDFVIIEVIRSDPQEKFGAVIATRLDNWEFPLIRYALGDFASRTVEDHECPLGLPFKVIGSILGRQYDSILLPDGRLIHSSLLISLLDDTPGVRQYQLYQQTVSKFEVLVILDPGSNLETADAFIQGRMRAFLGDVGVSVLQVPFIPQGPSGKFRLFRSELKEYDH